MLVVNISGNFIKKAVGKTIFICYDGLAIKQTIEAAIFDGEGKSGNRKKCWHKRTRRSGGRVFSYLEF